MLSIHLILNLSFDWWPDSWSSIDQERRFFLKCSRKVTLLQFDGKCIRKWGLKLYFSAMIDQICHTIAPRKSDCPVRSISRWAFQSDEIFWSKRTIFVSYVVAHPAQWEELGFFLNPIEFFLNLFLIPIDPHEENHVRRLVHQGEIEAAGEAHLPEKKPKVRENLQLMEKTK